jgi:hypothetical protein
MFHTFVHLKNYWRWSNWLNVPCRVLVIDCNCTEPAQVSSADTGLPSLPWGFGPAIHFFVAWLLSTHSHSCHPNWFRDRQMSIGVSSQFVQQLLSRDPHCHRNSQDCCSCMKIFVISDAIHFQCDVNFTLVLILRLKVLPFKTTVSNPFKMVSVFRLRLKFSRNLLLIKDQSWTVLRI